jgi:glycosyltransferase involved in cell wall biosynthesis
VRREVRIRIRKVGYKDWLAEISRTPGTAIPVQCECSQRVASIDGGKPRVLLLADYPQWAQDRAAQAISRRLSDEFEFRIAYVSEGPDLSVWEFDLIFVLFWGEEHHLKYVMDSRGIIKQVSSHRWGTEKRYGLLTASEAVYVYFRDAGTLTVPSRRLQTTLWPFREVFLAQKGFEPSEFKVLGPRSGELRIGWAGSVKDPTKGLTDVLLPAAGSDFQLFTAAGDLRPDDMRDFYNSVDVICVASTAEGDPLTLIEGMACGCFPVAVDVGIVPELVRDGDNGLIVGRDSDSFRAAFEWCAAHLEHVREAGLRNAQEMLETRTWDHVSRQWREVLRHVYRGLSGPPDPR